MLTRGLSPLRLALICIFFASSASLGVTRGYFLITAEGKGEESPFEVLSSVIEKLSIRPDPLIFSDQTGSCLIGETCRQRIIVTNEGLRPIVISDVTLSSDSSSLFLSQETCSQQLDPGESCYVEVGYAPATEEEVEAEVRIGENRVEVRATPMTSLTCGGSGASGNPIRICTLSQLLHLREFLYSHKNSLPSTVYVRVEQDLDGKGSTYYDPGATRNRYRMQPIVFDGQNHTISNFVLISGKDASFLPVALSTTIQQLKIKNVTLLSPSGVTSFAQPESDNCESNLLYCARDFRAYDIEVENSTFSGAEASSILFAGSQVPNNFGIDRTLTMSNISLKNVKITSQGPVGSLISVFQGHSLNIVEVVAENVEISGKEEECAALIGRVKIIDEYVHNTGGYFGLANNRVSVKTESNASCSALVGYLTLSSGCINCGGNTYGFVQSNSVRLLEGKFRSAIISHLNLHSSDHHPHLEVGKNEIISQGASSLVGGIFSIVESDISYFDDRNAYLYVENNFVISDIDYGFVAQGLSSISGPSSGFHIYVRNNYLSGRILVGHYIDVEAISPDDIDKHSSNNYFNSDLTSKSSLVFSFSGLTTEQMKHQSNFVGFDFSSVWSIIEGETYPFLQSLGNPWQE